MIHPANILVVDDDDAFRASTERFLRSVGLDVECYASPEPLLDREPANVPTCVLLDLRMPGMSGLEAQVALAQHGFAHPIVFMSGCADVATSIMAMKRGAFDFIVKPFEEQELLDALERALAADLRVIESRASHRNAQARLRRLTNRERQVCDLLMHGLLNKQIAGELGIAESTVKVHRSRMMEKLGVDSLIALIRLRDEADAEAKTEPGVAGPGRASA